jgi:energy-coupling factor transporter ATP-binding protein EcfA2
MSDGIQQKLVLSSITLRGVGSYLKGARLEIRPLTILCGKNGSGKSTWIKMLNRLNMSERLLPFRFEMGEDEDEFEEGWPAYGPYTNALVRLIERKGERKGIASYEEDVAYGPLGTIGLQFESTEPLDLDGVSPLPKDIDAESPAHAFLWKGTCARGTKFEIRMAHPLQWPGDQGEELYDFVELRFNQETIRFKKPVDFTKGPSSISEPYRLSCSKSP